MTTDIIVSVLSAIKQQEGNEPTETAYFTVVQGDAYSNHRLPVGWQQIGSTISGYPHRKIVTITLPDYIKDTPFKLRSDYTAQDGFADLVFVYCNPIKVDDSIESAIDEAIKTVTVSAPTREGKRESIPFKINHISKIYDDVHPSQISK